MKIKVKDLRNLIRENYAREIPQHAVDETCLKVIRLKMNPSQAADYCRDQLEHYFKMHINSTSVSPADMRQKIVKMHQVLANMQEEIRELKKIEEDLKEIVDQHVSRFLYI